LPFHGPIEIWTKWTSEALEVDSNKAIKTIKRRWLRKFDTTEAKLQEIPLGENEKPLDDKRQLPVLGCNVELTEVTIPTGEKWWTLGFEAFGTIGTVENDIRKVATMLAERLQSSFSGGLLASYPHWLMKL